MEAIDKKSGSAFVESYKFETHEDSDFSLHDRQYTNWLFKKIEVEKLKLIKIIRHPNLNINILLHYFKYTKSSPAIKYAPSIDETGEIK